MVAAGIEDLHLIDHFGGKVSQRCIGVVAEERPAVHQHTLYVLTLRLDAAIDDRHAGHLLYQIVGVSILVDLEGISIELRRVAFLQHGDDAFRDHDVFGLDSAGRQTNGAHAHRSIGDGDRSFERSVAHERDAHGVSAPIKAFNCKDTLPVRHSPLHRRVLKACECYTGTVERLIVDTIDDCTGGVEGLSGN